MNEEQIREMCNEIYTGGEWQPMIDYITNLQTKYENQIHRYMNLKEYTTNLQEENEFLKLNNPEMNIEHFRIIKENKKKINNLRKENKKLKEQISNSLKLCENLMKEKDKLYNHLCLEMRNDDKKIIKKAIEHIKEHQLIYTNQYEEESNFDNHLLDILNGGDE